MYIFNPEHDLCLANGDPHFVPPDSALTFGRDCADLTKYMKGLDPCADSGKAILPWGWNHQLRNRLLKEGYDAENLLSPERIDLIAELSNRKFAQKCLEYISSKMGDIKQHPITTESYRIVAHSIEEVNHFIARHHNVVLKAPLSGSGKGIRFVSDQLSHSDNGWCRNLISRHGCVIVEQRLTILQEFAMLFRCIGGNVEFCGYSLFYSHNGAYRGNILASNRYIEGKLSRFIPLEVLMESRKLLTSFLKSEVAGKYDGFVGVDQFYSEEMGFNPVVEMNIRMTMGLLARNIYDCFPCAGDGTHCFEINRQKVDGQIKYSWIISEIE